MKKCNEHILKALELSRQLFILSDEGEADATDNSCRVLYGIIRDAAYKIKNQAQKEREMHETLGKWENKENLSPLS